MKPAEIKARQWLSSMHLRPVYLVEAGTPIIGDDDLIVYIAVAVASFDTDRGHKLFLVPVKKNLPSQYVSYQNRGSIYPWSDIETATEVCFKSEIAAKIEELSFVYKLNGGR